MIDEEKAKILKSTEKLWNERNRLKELEKENAELKENHESDKQAIKLMIDKGTNLEKENAKLFKMLEIVLPKALEHENHIFYEHKRTLEQYRAELEERVENEK